MPSTVPLSKGLEAVVDAEIVVVTFAQHRAVVSELAGAVTLLVRQSYTTSQSTIQHTLHTNTCTCTGMLIHDGGEYLPQFFHLQLNNSMDY